MAHSLSRLLTAPLNPLPAADERRARLLAGLLLMLMGLGLVVSLIQLATVPKFLGTFTTIVAAILVLCAAYCGSRTWFYRLSAVVACVAPAAACAVAGALNPADPVWYAFMLITVVFATIFLPPKAAMAMAVGVFVALCVVLASTPELRSVERAVPILSLHAVLSPLLLLSAHHQRALESATQEELRRRDAQIAEAQRLAAIGLLARGVIHDFNSLLMVVVEHARHLEPVVGETGREDLLAIRSASEKAKVLTRQILTFASGQPAKPQPIDVNVLLTELQPLLARMAGARIRIALDCDRAPALVTADRLQLEQVLMNLVVNARDAMADGGVVTIETQNVDLDPRHAAQHDGARSGPHIVIAVMDTGVGVAQAELDRVFEPFFTTKGDGRGGGLGLAIVRDIAGRSGGHVTVVSKPGEGATFRVYLPANGSRQAST